MSRCSSPSLANCLKCIDTHEPNLKNTLRRDLVFLRRSNNNHKTMLLIIIILTIFIIFSYMMVIVFKKY
jgi:hypothetical protein